MKTTKPLSAISYNTASYLSAVCASLLKNGLLTNYAYIRHTGEDGDKDHIHLLLFPAKALETVNLSTRFHEAVGGEEKPRALVGLKPCASVVDWVRYAVHDPAYLTIKGERRHYRYRYDDIQVGSPAEWRAVMDQVEFTPLPCPSYQVARMIIYDALSQSMGKVTWPQLFRQIPFSPRDLGALKEYFQCIRDYVFKCKCIPSGSDVPTSEEWDFIGTPAADSSLRLSMT